MFQRGIENQYSNEKFNDFSNDMALRLLSKIQETGNVSLGEIINTDAQAFTRFGPNLEISKNDWPGAFIDNGFLGGDWIEASSDLYFIGFGLAALKGFGDDYLAGGKGNDTLDGGNGTNSYAFAKGDGHDTIIDSYQNTVTLIS